MDVFETAKTISELGVLIVIAALFLGGIFMILWKVFRKDGTVDIVVKRHVTFLDDMTKLLQKSNDIAGKQVLISKEQAEIMEQVKNDLIENTASGLARGKSLDRLFFAGSHVCDVLEGICIKLEIGEKAHKAIAEIRAQLGEHHK